MSALKRYTTSVDGTIPVPALLYQDEDVMASQEGVGIYDGSVSPTLLCTVISDEYHRQYTIAGLHTDETLLTNVSTPSTTDVSFYVTHVHRAACRRYTDAVSR